MDLRASKPRALFLTDNGCCLCGQHLGSSARFTGRDISGQPIVELTPEIIAAEGGGWTPACETCGHQLDARGVALPLEPDDEREVCHECDGSGERTIYSHGGRYSEEVECERCEGRGTLDD